MSTAAADDIEEVRELSHRQMTKEQCLMEIGRKLGVRGHLRSSLTKQDLNSIVWALTGETECQWIDFGTDRSPDTARMRAAVSEAVGFAYHDGIRPKTERGSRSFRRNELRALVYALRENKDQRDHFEGRDG